MSKLEEMSGHQNSRGSSSATNWRTRRSSACPSTDPTRRAMYHLNCSHLVSSSSSSREECRKGSSEKKDEGVKKKCPEMTMERAPVEK